jgi:[glutamine synthetase] adenylyltransferase / [glutamine synthetase]-adenylyl-L-tyrosine phosphorylase
MAERNFADPAHTLPPPFDAARAARTFDGLADEGFTPGNAHWRLLQGVFGNSPYLARLALREPEFLRVLLDRGPHAMLTEIGSRIEAADAIESHAALMSALRGAKRQAALSIALADIAGIWPLENVTGALSRFADQCVRAAVRFLLRQAAAHTALAETPAEELESTTGLIVLAMGKYGALELNYSSDIDLIVFYDSDRFPFRKRGDPRAAAVDIVKGIVSLLSEVTADGYVFRVDLRLRPDAGATQIAVTAQAAEAYYEGMGQNWERAALIKARACAGDLESALQFLKAIEPFVWRRNLDYAAIEDIHSIKRQIHAHAGHEKIAVAGHNIKLGRGGIREIEFFVQTQQLILGGRHSVLRTPSTLATLEVLRERGLVSRQAADELGDAYRFLRKLEHRLQMVEDEQTHTIPRTAEGLQHIACFMGFTGVAEFDCEVRRHLETVQQHYVRLFERAPPLASAQGSLVFTGVEDDPETLNTLRELGFSDVHHVAAAIRGWHHGRIRATRSARGRELLTKLIPPLLQALGATADSNSAFAQFDRFLTRVPSGVQLFSLLLANPQLLKLIADICGSAPRFADHLARSPKVLDAILDAGFLGERFGRDRLEAALAEQLAAAEDYEATLDAARRFASEEMFRAGVQVLEGTITPDAAGHAFTEIAEAVICGLMSAVTDEFAGSSGEILDGQFAIVAMGRLGGREMTATSDLDLIFVYDAPAGVEHSSGLKPLPVPAWYARLAQRLIAALTAHTAEGGLYDVDMRLRPTGNKGPVAVSLASFERYHATESWTWERMALTRARVIFGPDALRKQIDSVIRKTLSASADPTRLQTDVRDMRQMLAANYPPKSHWNLKFAKGGLVDVEFVAQYLQLREASAHPYVLDVSTVPALCRLEDAAVLDADAANTLLEAAALQQTLLQLLRIALDSSFDSEKASSGLKQFLARTAGETDFAALDARLQRTQAAARRVFEALLC